MAKTNLTTKPMNIADYLNMMDANAHLYPDWAKMTDSEQTYTALHMMKFGSAEGIFDGDTCVGCQGILQLGIGEAWMVVDPDLRGRKGELLRHAIADFKRLRDVDGYMKIFAGNVLSETFLKHLGFEQDARAHIWTRKE